MSPWLTAVIRNTAGYVANTGHPALGCALGFASTHAFINHQALVILYCDERKTEARLLTRHQRFLDSGACRADGGIGCTSHYYNPHTKRGLRWCTPATQACTRHFFLAVTAWLYNHPRRAMLHLGMATHLVQDACVPHHAHGLVRLGHGKYEKWVQQNREQYAVTSDGLYRPTSLTPAEWVISNSRVAYEYLWLVAKSRNEDGFHQATKDLLALAQRSTAGFWLYFLKKVGATHSAD